MKTYTLKRRQLIRESRKEVFEFFEQPENLEKITPKSVGFNILTPRPIKMQSGTTLDYTIRLLGIPVRWTTLITNYDRPDSFSDVALRGPYSFWHHTHTFEQDGDNTIMTDEVRYVLPLGILGRVCHRLWVKRQLDYIFDYRARIIDEVLSTSKSSVIKRGELVNPRVRKGK
jgi:ligand-binding SRPBCC domain-containing protein